jgi:hypothetical protein
VLPSQAKRWVIDVFGPDTRSSEPHHRAYAREHESTSRVAEGASLARRQIRDPPLASERMVDLAPGQLETTAQIGNYDWNYPKRKSWRLARNVEAVIWAADCCA